MFGQTQALLALPMFTQRSNYRQRIPRRGQLLESFVKSLLCPIQTDEHGEIRLGLSVGFRQQEILLKTFPSFQNREPNLSQHICLTRPLSSPCSPIGDLAL